MIHTYIKIPSQNTEEIKYFFAGFPLQNTEEIKYFLQV